MKTVWILGAGFSKQGGYPVVSDFLNPSYFVHWLIREELRAAGRDVAYRMMPQVEHWTKLGSDLNRLMSGFLERQDFVNARKLNTFILETLDMIALHHRDVYHLPYLNAFVNQIGGTDSCVISFNYDTLVEEKLCHLYAQHHAREGKRAAPIPLYTLGLDPKSCLSITDSPNFRDYGSGYLPFALPSAGALKILKIHGSTCLWYCQNCSTPLYRTPTDPIGPKTAFDCPACKRETEQDLLFVPPASDRSFFAWEVMEPLWAQAEQELLTARDVIIVGYSLPAEDERARSLLSSVARHNPGLRALIVDPFMNDAQRKRFAEVFPNPLFLREDCQNLMGILAALRTRKWRKAALKELDPAVGSMLRDIVSEEAARPGGPLPGAIPIEADPADLVFAEGEQELYQYSAINMLGLSRTPALREMLHRRAKSSGLDLWTRGAITRALGNIAEQRSVDWLSGLLFEITPYEIKKTGLPGFTLPQTVAICARSGILQVAFSDPTLDFKQAVSGLALLLALGVLMEHEQMQAMSALQILSNIYVLNNRYSPEDCFGIDPARAVNKIYDFRGEPRKLQNDEIDAMIKEKGFYDLKKNPEGGGVVSDYAAPFIAGHWVVIDYASGLMWALGTHMSWVLRCGYMELESSLAGMNERGYAGYNDWRLPTLEEAMSLLKPPTHDGWCEDPIFLRRVDRIWTCDRGETGALVVYVLGGYQVPAWQIDNIDAYMRPVRKLDAARAN